MISLSYCERLIHSYIEAPIIVTNRKDIPIGYEVQDAEMDIYNIMALLCMILFLISNTIVLPLWWWKSRERELRLRLCLTNIVPVLCFIVSYWDYGKVYALFHIGNHYVFRAKYIARSFDWTLGILNIIWSLKMIAESSQMKYKNTTEKLKSPTSNGEFLISPKSLLMLYLGYGYEDTSHELVQYSTKTKVYVWIGQWFMMVWLGYIASLCPNTFTKMLFYLGSSLFFVPVSIGIHGLVDTDFVTKKKIAQLTLQDSPINSDRGETIDKFSAIDEEDQYEEKYLAAFNMVLRFYSIYWFVYPIVWLPAEFLLISVDTENIVYAVLDVISKGLFPTFLCNVGCMMFDQSENATVLKEQKLSKMRSDFFLNMNHELRTPLNAVIGLSQVLLTSDSLTSQQESCSQAIYVSAQTLLYTINDVLDFSRIETKGVKLEKQVFNLEQCIDEAADVIAVKAHEKNLDLVVQLKNVNDSNLLRKVSGDSFRLRQVIINLANNAVKFTSEGGTISIVTEVKRISRTNIVAKIRVTDNGIGIDPEHIPTLFEPFSSATDRTITGYGGSGLGLSISKKLVELMGGSLQVENSELNVGTTILMKIPFTIVEESEDNKSIQRNENVLILEPKLVKQEYLKSICNYWGFETTTLDAESSLQEISSKFLHEPSHSFEFLIVDFDMFCELLKKIGESNVFKIFSRVIILTKFNQTSKCKDIQIASYQNNTSPYSSQVKFIMRPMKRIVLQNYLVTKTTWLSRKHITPKLPPTNNGSKSPIILLAEDNKLNQKVVSLILKKLGYDFDVVDNGKRAVEAVFDKKYDLILMDVQMPVMDGIKATKMIREAELSNKISKIVIVALTAGSTKENFDECLNAGMDDFVTKPIELNTLTNVLQRYLV